VPTAKRAWRIHAAPAVYDFEQASLAADVRDHLVASLRAGVPDHVRAGLGDREQDVTHAALVHAEAAEGIPEHPAHDRYAQRFSGEDQAELHVRGLFPRMEHPSSHSLLSPVTGYRQFTFSRLPRLSCGNHELRRSLDEQCGTGR
jgi:hypothetical protein